MEKLGVSEYAAVWDSIFISSKRPSLHRRFPPGLGYLRSYVSPYTVYLNRVYPRSPLQSSWSYRVACRLSTSLQCTIRLDQIRFTWNVATIHLQVRKAYACSAGRGGEFGRKQTEDVWRIDDPYGMLKTMGNRWFTTSRLSVHMTAEGYLSYACSCRISSPFSLQLQDHLLLQLDTNIQQQSLKDMLVHSCSGRNAARDREGRMMYE